jgi:hypothetical protein
MLRTSSTGEIMGVDLVLKTTKQEESSDHLYERVPKITSLQYVVTIKQTILYDTDVKLYKGHYILRRNGRFEI